MFLQRFYILLISHSFSNAPHGFLYLYVLSMFYWSVFLLQRKEPILSDMWFFIFLFLSSSFFFFFFLTRPLVSLRLSSIKSVLMITWKYLMEKQKNHQFLDDYVAARYQSPLWPPEIKCLFGLFLMHLFKEKAFKPHILQVSKSGPCFSFLRSRFLFREWMQWIL